MYLFQISNYDDPAVDRETAELLHRHLEAESRRRCPAMDGVAVPGATASATAAAANDALDLNITALVRQVCCAAGSALTLVLTGVAATVNNVALRVQRI